MNNPNNKNEIKEDEYENKSEDLIESKDEVNLHSESKDEENMHSESKDEVNMHSEELVLKNPMPEKLIKKNCNQIEEVPKLMPKDLVEKLPKLEATIEEKKAAIFKAFNCTDIYINVKDLSLSYTYPGQKPLDQSDPLVNRVYKGFHSQIKKTLIKESHKKDHMIKYCGRLFRCYEIPTVDGGIVAARQMPPEFITLEKSGMNKRYIQELLNPRLRSGGLIIICGAPGNGKTTTCAATIDQRLKDFGGLCITIEDPVEISLQGIRGKGTCLQIQVENQHEFPDAVRGIMRAYPTGTDSIMLIGETRDAETASEALRSSIDGRLVITTMHANSPIEALQRFANIASKTMDSQDVNNMLSSSFRLAIHQELKMGKLIAQILVDEIDVQGAIRSGKFAGLKTQLQTQDSKVKTNQEFEYMKRN